MTDFTLFPAIDLKDGRCVRLLHGAFDQSTAYNDDPADQARRFADVGFDWLHIVDLDGAVAGEAANAASVEAILASTPARIQLGGGIRTLERVDFWLTRGVARVILGTAAVRDPAFVEAAARRHPGQVCLGVDARDGIVRTDGWAAESSRSAIEIFKRFEGLPLAAAIYTDIGRDGALTGVNVAATAALAGATTIPIIASGGVSGIEDIARLRAAEGPVAGVVIGRALYEGRIDPRAALRAVRLPSTV